MRVRRLVTGIVAVGAVVAMGGGTATGVTAAGAKKGPAAASHTRVLKGNVSAISCGSKALCVGVDSLPNHWAYALLTHDGAKARYINAKLALTPDLVDCPTAAGCTVLASTRSTYHWVDMAMSSHGALGKPLYLEADNSNSLLNALSCFHTRTHCTFVGSTNNKPSVLTVSGSSVVSHSVSTPAKYLGGALTSVSCPTASICYAAGAYGTSSKEVGAVVKLVNGVPTSTALVTSASYAGLTGIACENSTTCIAIGATIRHGSIYTIRNGKVVATKPVPKGMAVTGIACENSHLCDAIGSTPPPRSGNTLAAVLPIHNGKLGTLQKSTVTSLYDGGEGEATQPVTGFHNGIAAIGNTLNGKSQTILSIS